jgi:hypothetical protein
MIRMKSLYVFIIVLTAVLVVFNTLLQRTSDIDNINSEKIDTYEESPEQELSPEEQLVNKRRYNRLISKNSRSTSNRMNRISSYANGQLNGTWDQVRFLATNKKSYGFRVDGSVYDQANNVIYPISYAGHLWKINATGVNYAETKWELMNHHVNLKTSFIEGLSDADGNFRMVRSSENGMQYSLDEGRSWIDAAGVILSSSTFEGAVTLGSQGKRVFIVGVANSGKTEVYQSEDDGETYSTLSLSFSPGSHTVKLFKPFYSESVFVVALDIATSKISIFECGQDDVEFTLVNSPGATFNALTRVFGTYYNDQFHIYIAGGNSHIYYSSDKGATWQNTSGNNSHENHNVFPRTVHPIKPNIIFKGFTDINMSTNYGEDFNSFNHALGWDLQHAKMYERADGSFFYFVGMDFGCYISDQPENPSAYVQLNNDSPIQMCYDADHGQNFNSSFTATQDRGTMGYVTTTNESITNDVRTTDGLRVTLANNETSVWTWMYFGNIYRKSNFVIENSSLAGLNWTGNWWAAPMIASPYPGDDAVFVAAGNSLKKFTFNSLSNEIIQTEHYFNFEEEYNSKLSGFGYSNLNLNKWYASEVNGDFFYSEDGGQTFERTRSKGAFPIANDLAYNYTKNQHVIKASNIDEEKVYYAGVGNKFMVSTDGGETFMDLNNGLDIFRIRDFDFTLDEKFIFAACAWGGIWVYSVEDDYWYEMNDESVPFVDYTDVEYIVKENTVNFSSFGNGVLRFKLDTEEPEVKHPDALVVQVSEDNIIGLSWTDQSDNEEGFLVERASKGAFFQIATLPANQSSFIDSESLAEGKYLYRVQAVSSSNVSHYSNYAMAEIKPPGVISKDGWRVVSVSSQQTSAYGAALAFDDDPSSMWHTQWGVNPIPGHPHNLVIDMNETLNLLGFSYLPRQDNQWNGAIKDYEFFVSVDNANWERVAKGSFEKTKTKKEVVFDENRNARYLKLVSLSEVNGTSFASCAELAVFDRVIEAQVPQTPQFVQGGRVSDSEIELIWLDLSTDETGFQIERLVGSEFRVVDSVAKDETSFRLGGTSPYRSYTFRISAVNDAGSSPYSEPITIRYTEGDGILSISNEELTNSLRVYPNPFREELNFTSESLNSYYEWEIVALSGKKLMSGIIDGSSRNFKIETQSLLEGVYVIRLLGKKGWVSKPIIKK